MSFWSTIGDIGAGIISQPLNVLGIKAGQDKLFSSKAAASGISQSQKVVAAVATTAAGIGAVNKATAKPVNATETIYTDDNSILANIGKAFGGSVQLGSDGKVTGSLEVGRPQNASIMDSFAKYWWVVAIAGLFFLITKRK